MHRTIDPATICGVVRVFTDSCLDGIQGKPVVVVLFCGGGGDRILDQTSVVVSIASESGPEKYESEEG